MVQSMSAIYLQCFCAFVMYAGKNSLEIPHLIYRLPFFLRLRYFMAEYQVDCGTSYT